MFYDVNVWRRDPRLLYHFPLQKLYCLKSRRLLGLETIFVVVSIPVLLHEVVSLFVSCLRICLAMLHNNTLTQKEDAQTILWYVWLTRIRWKMFSHILFQRISRYTRLMRFFSRHFKPLFSPILSSINFFNIWSTLLSFATYSCLENS